VSSHEQEVGRALVLHNRTLLAYVRRRLRSAADAEDVVQEAMARVLSRARGSLIADPLSYAMRTARNILIDNGRATRPPVSLDDLEGVDTPIDAAATPLEALDMTERLQLFQAALEAMPRLRREVFIRRRVEEQAYDVIARDLKLSTEAVQKHYSRAALMLRQAVEG
jgi:RNA polymerase sigma factor (sigma-70 family)